MPFLYEVLVEALEKDKKTSMFCSNPFEGVNIQNRIRDKIKKSCRFLTATLKVAERWRSNFGCVLPNSMMNLNFSYVEYLRM